MTAAIPANIPASIEQTNGTATPAPATASATEPKPQSNPFDRCVLLSLTINELGVTRKVSTDTVAVDTDKSMIRVSKKILDCEEYAAIKTVVGQFKKYLRARVVPGAKFFKNGIYAVPLAFLTDIDEKLTAFTSVFNATVARFVEVYEARAAEARVRLNVLADQMEYPSVEKVRQAFGISSEYVTLGPPSSIAGVSKEIWDRENKRIMANCQQAADDVRDALRLMLSELVDHMIERMTPDKDGKRKKLSKTMIPNFKEFIDLFAQRNVMDDAVLAGLVAKTKEVLAGKSLETLKQDPDARSFVRERMSQIKGALDTMIVNVPGRQIDLED